MADPPPCPECGSDLEEYKLPEIGSPTTWRCPEHGFVSADALAAEE